MSSNKEVWKYFSGLETHWAFVPNGLYLSSAEYTLCGFKTGRLKKDAEKNPTNRDVDCVLCLKKKQEQDIARRRT